MSVDRRSNNSAQQGGRTAKADGQPRWTDSQGGRTAKADATLLAVCPARTYRLSGSLHWPLWLSVTTAITLLHLLQTLAHFPPAPAWWWGGGGGGGRGVGGGTVHAVSHDEGGGKWSTLTFRPVQQQQPTVQRCVQWFSVSVSAVRTRHSHGKAEPERGFLGFRTPRSPPLPPPPPFFLPF